MLSTIILYREKVETMEMFKIGDWVHKLWCKWWPSIKVPETVAQAAALGSAGPSSGGGAGIGRGPGSGPHFSPGSSASGAVCSQQGKGS